MEDAEGRGTGCEAFEGRRVEGKPFVHLVHCFCAVEGEER